MTMPGSNPMAFPKSNMKPTLRPWLLEILAEDLGPAGRDVSVVALGENALMPAVGEVKAKAPGILCGTFLLEEIVRAVEEVVRPGFSAASIQVRLRQKDGCRLEKGLIIAELDGPVGILLIAERTLLNFLQRLSGVATLTRAFVDAVHGTRCKILDTRKTTPGLRFLEKQAVQTGGGINHRFGLYDMVMLKDNHIAASRGDIRQAVQTARSLLGPTVKIEVEAATTAQVQAALDAGADFIMLDNMPSSEMQHCVALVNNKVPLEASGGITLETVRAVAATGVDFISVGALTHSAPALDISMKIRIL